MKNFVQIIFIVFVVTILSFATCAYANEFSDGPIEIVIPYGAGGSHDMNARGIVSVAADYFGPANPIKIVLMPGGTGSVGSIYVKNAKPDGHTLLFGNNANMVMPHIVESGYSIEDFRAVCRFNYAAPLFVSSKESGITSIEELVAKVKENPGKLVYSHGGLWGVTHIPWLLFVDQAGLDMIELPTEGGGPSLQAVLSGDVAFTATFVSVLIDHIRAGNLFPLAVGGAERLDELPDVPTFIELGYDNVSFDMWRVILAPKDTPDEIVEYLSDRFEELGKDPSLVKFLSKMGEKVQFVDYKEFDQELKELAVTYKNNLSKYYKY